MAITQGNGFGHPRINTDVLSSLELINEDNATEFYKLFPDMRGGLLAQLEAEGSIKKTDQEVYRMWLSNTKPFNKFTVDADVVITASAAVTVNVVTYADAGETLSVPTVGDFLIENSSGIEFEVRAVSKTTAGAHTATIAPTSTGVTETILEADAEFINVGRLSVQEASFQQDGQYTAWAEKENEISIVRTNKAYTDLVSMEKIKFFGQDYMSLDSTDFNRRHVDSKEVQFMFGKNRNNIQSTGNRNSNALGVLEIVKQWGTSFDGVGGAGQTLDTAFFEDLAMAIDGNGFTNSYMGLADTKAFFDIQAFLKAESIAPVQILVNDGEDIKAIFDYSDAFKIGGINFRFKKYDYWNTARLAGADVAKSALAGQILLMPDGQGVDGSGEFRSYVRARYMDNNLSTDDNRGVLNKLDKDGALFGLNTTREAQLSLVSYIGADVMGAEGFVWIKTA